MTQCLGFTPDGYRLVTTGADRVIRVWDATPVRDGEHLGDERRTLRGRTNGVVTARFLPGGKEVVTASADDTVRRFPLTPSTGLEPVLATGEGIAVAVAPTGEALAVAEGRGRACRLVNPRTGQALKQLDSLGVDEQVFRLVFSPDGTQIAACDSGGNTVYVWDCGTGRVRRLAGHTYYTYGVAFRAGWSRTLLTSVSTAGEVYVWDPTSDQEPLARFEHPAATAVAFSRDGRRMSTAGWDRAVRVWDTSDDDPRRWSIIDTRRDPTGGPNALAFGPDASVLVWGGTDSAVKVWKAGTGEVATLQGHRDWVWDVDFGPAGREIVTASRDGTVKLWPNPFADR